MLNDGAEVNTQYYRSTEGGFTQPEAIKKLYRGQGIYTQPLKINRHFPQSDEGDIGKGAIKAIV